jgi:hypothetical protein
VGQRAFVVRHLVTDGELKLFDTNSRMMQKGNGFPASGAEIAGTRG